MPVAPDAAALSARRTGTRTHWWSAWRAALGTVVVIALLVRVWLAPAGLRGPDRVGSGDSGNLPAARQSPGHGSARGVNGRDDAPHNAGAGSNGPVQAYPDRPTGERQPAVNDDFVAGVAPDRTSGSGLERVEAAGDPEGGRLTRPDAAFPDRCMRHFHNRPSMGPGRKLPWVAFNQTVEASAGNAIAGGAGAADSEAPDYSVILTVHNGEGLVEALVRALGITTRGRWELVVVVDGSVDGSDAAAVAAARNLVLRHTRSTSTGGGSGGSGPDCTCCYDALAAATTEPFGAPVVEPRLSDRYLGQRTQLQRLCAAAAGSPTSPGLWSGCGRLTRVLVVVQPSGVWETSANNMGMCYSHPRTSYFALVQDDQFMTQVGWNVQLSLPHRAFDDVLSSGARCAHNVRAAGEKKVGRCSGDVEDVDHPTLPQDGGASEGRTPFTVRDTANRGPLLLSAPRARALGLFDETLFLLGDDDHDLHRRAYTQHKWIAGLFSVAFYSPLAWGGSRSARATAATLALKKHSDSNRTLNNMTPAAEREYKAWRKEQAQTANVMMRAMRDHSEERWIADDVVLRLIRGQRLCRPGG